MVTLEVKFWVRLGLSWGCPAVFGDHLWILATDALEDDGVDRARGWDYFYVGGRLRITR